MPTADMRALRRYIIVSVISVMTPFLMAYLGFAIKDHFQIKANTEQLKNKMNSETFIMYINVIQEQNKLLKEDVESIKKDNIERCQDNKDQLQELRQRQDDLWRQIYSGPRGTKAKADATSGVIPN